MNKLKDVLCDIKCALESQKKFIALITENFTEDRKTARKKAIEFSVNLGKILDEIYQALPLLDKENLIWPYNSLRDCVTRGDFFDLQVSLRVIIQYLSDKEIILSYESFADLISRTEVSLYSTIKEIEEILKKVEKKIQKNP